MERLPPEFVSHGQDLSFPDARCPHHGQIVPPPLFGYADAHLAQTDDVRDIFIILLHFDRGEDEGPFFVNIPCVPHVSSGLGVAAIGLMRLDPDRIVVHSFIVDHRNQDSVVGRVGAPVVRRIVEERIPPLQAGMQFHHGAGHKIRPTKMVDGQGFRPGEEFAILRDNARRKVPGKIKNTRPSRTQKRVGHLGGDGFEPFVQDS